jgi:GNAT superfamily N-acetyltransferase
VHSETNNTPNAFETPYTPYMYVENRYAHWPIATHTTVSHRITVALAIDRSPGDTRVKIKYIDAHDPNEPKQADLGCEVHLVRARLPEDVYRQQVQNGRYHPKMGLLLLERRSGNGKNTSSFLGMQIHEQYRGRGLSKVFVAIWLALCLAAGVSAYTGTIDKPILAHVLQSLGFTGKGGARVHLTDAKRLRDCTISRQAVGGTVQVNAEFVPPDDAELRRRVEEILAADSGELLIIASSEQIRAAFDGSWRQDGKVVI